MRNSSLMLIGATAFVCQACFAPYKFVKDEKTAQLQSLGFQAPVMCIEGEMYSIPKLPRAKNYVIPAERRITLIQSLSVDSYPLTYFCSARVSFTPVADAVYVSDLNQENDSCVIEVVEQHAASFNGLRIVRGADDGVCASGN